MNTTLRSIMNNPLHAVLREGIGSAMKYAANETIQDILGRFYGDILDEHELRRYCDRVYRDVRNVVDDMMIQIFDEPIVEED